MAKKRKTIPLVPGWVLYLRTSSKEAQNPKASQERQQYNIELQILNMSELDTIFGIYIDNESGRNPNRTNYQRMLRDARLGKFSHIAIESPERFGRDAEEAIRAYNELTRLGIEIRFATHPFISDHATAELMIHLAFVMSHFESKNISIRVSGGLYNKMRHGGFTGRAPDGYINMEQRSDVGSKLIQGRYHRWIEKNPERYPIIRLAWDLLLEDRYTLAEICEILHAKGYTFQSGRPFVKLNQRGKKVHARNGLSRIYHNWFYAGWIVGKVGENEEILPKTTPGLWEAMVTTEDFERGLQILDKRKCKRNPQRKHFYLLRKLAFIELEEEIQPMSGSHTNINRSTGGKPLLLSAGFQCQYFLRQG